ncbi:MAG: helix-turn-helix domain-containing protein [Nanoarchaeota archaeon]
MDEKIFETLRSAGLTEGESRTYLALSSLGTSKVGPIIERSRISASKAYNILDRLMHKGLVSMTVMQGTKMFSTTEPEKLMDYLEEEERRIEKHKEEIMKIMPMLNAQRESLTTRPPVEISIGEKGFESFTHEMAEQAHEEDTYIVLASYTISSRLQKYWSGVSEELSMKGIRQHSIYDYDTWHRKDPKIHRRSERVKYHPRVLQEKHVGLPNISTLGDLCLVITIEDGKILNLLIRQKGLTDAFRKLLTILYETAQVPQGYEKKEIEMQ